MHKIDRSFKPFWVTSVGRSNLSQNCFSSCLFEAGTFKRGFISLHLLSLLSCLKGMLMEAGQQNRQRRETRDSTGNDSGQLNPTLARRFRLSPALVDDVMEQIKWHSRIFPEVLRNFILRGFLITTSSSGT